MYAHSGTALIVPERYNARDGATFSIPFVSRLFLAPKFGWSRYVFHPFCIYAIALTVGQRGRLNLITMKIGEILEDKICSVYLHQEERVAQGADYGNYSSHYIARLSKFVNGIVVIDRLATNLHPDWNRKTKERAECLGKALRGKGIKFKIMDVFPGNAFEGELI